MSQEADAQVLTGKAKKAKRSEERYKKNKKSKVEGTTDDTPKNDEPAAEVDDSNATSDKSSSKKRKRSQEEKEQQAPAEDAAPAEPKQQKKRKKEPSANKEPLAKKEGDATTTTEGDEAAKNQRFIVFIGNLPFTATTEQIKEHFASIQPQSVRHSTEKGTNKSKGFAFLEFANYDRMKTCLKLYHHSMFDSGVGGERGKRRINVELTAGGGGSKSEGRKEKLKEKNVRLNEQRQRRAEAEAKQEKRKAAKEAKKGGAPGAKEEEAPEPEVDAGAQEGIHPARLAMLQRINNR